MANGESGFSRFVHGVFLSLAISGIIAGVGSALQAAVLAQRVNYVESIIADMGEVLTATREEQLRRSERVDNITHLRLQLTNVDARLAHLEEKLEKLLEKQR